MGYNTEWEARPMTGAFQFSLGHLFSYSFVMGKMKNASSVSVDCNDEQGTKRKLQRAVFSAIAEAVERKKVTANILWTLDSNQT